MPTLYQDTGKTYKKIITANLETIKKTIRKSIDIDGIPPDKLIISDTSKIQHHRMMQLEFEE